MPREFSKTNTSSVVDIRRPSSGGSNSKSSFKKVSVLKSRTTESQKNFQPQKGKKNEVAKKRFRRILFVVGVVFLITVGIVAFSLYDLNAHIISSLKNSVTLFEESSSNIDPFNPETFKFNAGENILSSPSPILEFGSKIIPIIKAGVGAYKTFQDVVGSTMSLLQKSSAFFSDAPSLIFSQRGPELISRLEEINNLISEINSKSASLASQTSDLKNVPYSSSDLYLPIQVEMGQINKFLNTLIPWLKEPKDRHLLVLLENPSEMRPTGGFIGSFADVTLRNANVVNIEVHDINDADRELDLKVVPPKPIQVIATRWRAADANWFFDFPTSAKKVKYFIESSNIYKNKPGFDGVVAVSHNVIADLLALSGPIEIPDEKITIDKDNFLTEIQRQVQENRAKKDSYPKRILQKITPTLLEKIANLSDDNKKKLLGLVLAWGENKEVRLVLEEAGLQDFLDANNLSGRVFEIPQGFYGDYLAVVNSNLGGSKTDLFINQKITLTSQINEDGTVVDHLLIERRHDGNKSKLSWYNVFNQDYLKIFTPSGSRLDNHSGSIAKTIKAPVNYKSSGYSVDEDVSKVESTEADILSYSNIKALIENNRNVFAFWSKIDPGKTANLSLDYIHRLPSPPVAGRKYTFVFEKQPGVQSDYKFEISAPVGFFWEENNLPIFEYSSSDISGRMVIELTLKKI